MLIVGSKALKHHFPQINREVKDIDIIGTNDNIKYLINALLPRKVRETKHITTLIDIQKQNEFFNTKNVEILNADNSESLRKYINYDTHNGYLGNGLRFASPEVILSLKKSHIHFPIKFDKHISDYCFLINHFNGVDKLSDITKLNFKETEERVGKLRTPSLNKSTKEFFGQSDGFVQTFFIHDDIHRVMAHYDMPLYERMQKDSTLAKCEKDMWNEFTFEDKCKCVLEEAYVIALERKVLPSVFGGKKWVSPEEAINWSLMRVCTTLCSGWFRQFATDNYLKIKDFINRDYVEKFLTAYQNGEIRKNKS